MKERDPSGRPQDNAEQLEKNSPTTLVRQQEHEKSKPSAANETTDKDLLVPADKQDFRLNRYGLQRVLKYGSKLDFLVFGVATICSLGSGVVLPLMNIVFGQLVGGFSGYFTTGNGVSQEEFTSQTNHNALLIVYLFIGKFVLTYISMFCFRMAGLRVTANLRRAYLQAVFSLPISTLDEISSGTVSTTITSSSNTIQSSIADRLAVLFQSLGLLISAYAVAFKYSWQLTLAATSSIVFMLIVYTIGFPLLIKSQKEAIEADEKHASIAAEIFGSIRTVFSLGAKRALSEKYFHWVDISRQRNASMAWSMGIQLGLGMFAVPANYALSFWLGLNLYEKGVIQDINIVITVFFSVLLVGTIIGSIVFPLMQITKAAAASTGFFKVIDSEGVYFGGLKEPDVSAQADIEFKDVRFAYPTRRDVPVLKGLNIVFEKGKTTALVGPSGCGKSTIVGLLERWYQVDTTQQGKNGDTDDNIDNIDKQTGDASESIINVAHIAKNSGSVFVDGHNLNDVNIKWWRAQIGLVQQEPFLFNDTIYNNVCLGLIGSQWEDESEEVKRNLVKSACKEAFADEFVERLPDGYATMVGESGIKLSGGQRQRLAIARSIVKRPTILILDEATSSIDVRGERIVQQALDKVAATRTTIMIAHRLSTIRKADHIIVLQNGAKVEEGSHDSLMSIDDGLYFNLVNAQKILSTPTAETGSAEIDNAIETEGLLDRETTLKDDEGVQRGNGERMDYLALPKIVGEQKSLWMLWAPILLSGMGCGGAYALESWFFAHLVQVFQYTGQQLTSSRNFWALMFFVLGLAVAVCYFLLGSMSTLVSAIITSTYRKEYYNNFLAQPVPFHDAENNSSGSLQSKLTTDPKQIQEAFSVNGAFSLISIWNLLGCVAISFSFGWKLSLVALLAALPVMFVAAFFRIRHEIKFEAMNAEVFAESSQFATEAIGAFRTVSSLTMEDYILRRFENLVKEQIRRAFRRASHATLVFALSDSVELCAMALTFWYGGQLLANRTYDPLHFFVIYIAVVQGGQAAGQAFSLTPVFGQATGAANRIFRLRSLNSKPNNQGRSSQEKVISTHQKQTAASVEIKNVAFKYPTRDVPIFHSLSLSITPGSFVAFVGPSGCGKTTVISLLERFYDPVAGTISFNGIPIDDIDVAAYRSQISLVSQEPTLFDGSIQENLLLGVPSSDEEDSEDLEAKMEQACRDAEIHDFITSLPDGYATQLGIRTQTALSGGQKQRVCIARALLRSPSLLLLDEATSSLDSQSEKLVQGALDRLAAKRNITIVAVAHRLATIQKADTIYVFGESERGTGSRVVEKGGHDELLRRRGMYWQMCQAQALDR
ncbi:putative ABC multidrug transporter [Talaromyces proteolyticus]|uniref:ABC multidrug transporter MDR2 n=1 Tax=Talaromyces proteolyticus TaxID=1131652 RepID=A0AAD4KZN9_9EURO|nr:putative ABC multidrug transporter [Talaromyces proteolyticus]KAH8703559.1 putative ABC multidrug transporter [Talaromyces proteolyticus]